MSDFLEIIQGQKKTFTVFLDDEETGKPVDLTSVSEITTCFEKTGGTLETLTLTGTDISVVTAAIGEILVTITAVKTDDFKVVSNATLEVIYDFGSGDVRKSQLLRAYSVKAKICT